MYNTLEAYQSLDLVSRIMEHYNFALRDSVRDALRYLGTASSLGRTNLDLMGTILLEGRNSNDERDIGHWAKRLSVSDSTQEMPVFPSLRRERAWVRGFTKGNPVMCCLPGYQYPYKLELVTQEIWLPGTVASVTLQSISAVILVQFGQRVAKRSRLNGFGLLFSEGDAGIIASEDFDIITNNQNFAKVYFALSDYKPDTEGDILPLSF